MTKHEKIVALRTALRNGVPLEYFYVACPWQQGGWNTAPTNTTSADIKRNPLNYRIKST
jgi:hypothetical protein